MDADTQKLIDRYNAAKERLRNADSAKNSAECELANATTALCKWLVPEDAKPEERFCVWNGDWLYEIVKSPRGMNDFTVAVTERGSKRKEAA